MTADNEPPVDDGLVTHRAEIKLWLYKTPQNEIIDTILRLRAAVASSDENVEREFKEGFVLGFAHRGRTDDPREAVQGAERDWQHRARLAAIREKADEQK